jgi:hypothetical protein
MCCFFREAPTRNGVFEGKILRNGQSASAYRANSPCIFFDVEIHHTLPKSACHGAQGFHDDLQPKLIQKLSVLQKPECEPYLSWAKNQHLGPNHISILVHQSSNIYCLIRRSKSALRFGSSVPSNKRSAFSGWHRYNERNEVVSIWGVTNEESNERTHLIASFGSATA